MTKRLESFITIGVIAVLLVPATSAAPSPRELVIYWASTPFGATSIYLATTPLGAESVYLSKSPLGADVRLGFVERPEDADLVIAEATTPFGGESIYFASSPLGATSVYFSSTPLGATTVYIATSGTVDLKVHVKEWKGSLKQLIAVLVALQRI